MHPVRNLAFALVTLLGVVSGTSLAEDPPAQEVADSVDKVALERLHAAYAKAVDAWMPLEPGVERDRARIHLDAATDAFLAEFRKVDVDAWDVDTDGEAILEAGCRLLAAKAMDDGDGNLAVRMFDRSMALRPSVDLDSWVIRGLERALLLTVGTPSALPRLEKVAQSVSAPRRAAHTERIGWLRAAAGEFDSARESLQGAANLAKEHSARPEDRQRDADRLMRFAKEVGKRPKAGVPLFVVGAKKSDVRPQAGRVLVMYPLRHHVSFHDELESLRGATDQVRSAGGTLVLVTTRPSRLDAVDTEMDLQYPGMEAPVTVTQARLQAFIAKWREDLGIEPPVVVLRDESASAMELLRTRVFDGNGALIYEKPLGEDRIGMLPAVVRVAQSR